MLRSRIARARGRGEAAPATAVTAPPAPSGAFAARLAAETLAAALRDDLTGNFDPLRHPDGPPPSPSPEDAGAMLAALLHDAELARLYDEWADDASRDLMVRLLAFRLLGAAKVRLPLADGRMEAATARAEALRRVEGSVDLAFLEWTGDRFDLADAGYPVVVDAHVLNVVALLVDQYRCPAHPAVAVRPGDVVVDGGACWGDTALVFAHLAGPEGRVRSFEFEPGNVTRMRSNLALNAELAERVELDERALWRRTGEQLGATRFGPATNIGAGGDLPVVSVAIDDLVAGGELPRVDFLKLDVEGAELAALEGARQTLLRDRPRLAIALYHRPDDWTTIPRFLRDLGVGYRFSLGHFTVHAEETVLFAWTGDVGDRRL
jgi:FkbM family methyltransferase